MIQVHESDIRRLQCPGISVAGLELSKVAKYLIITAESMIGYHVIRLDPA